MSCICSHSHICWFLYNLQTPPPNTMLHAIINVCKVEQPTELSQGWLLNFILSSWLSSSWRRLRLSKHTAKSTEHCIVKTLLYSRMCMCDCHARCTSYMPTVIFSIIISNTYFMAHVITYILVDINMIRV